VGAQLTAGRIVGVIDAPAIGKGYGSGLAQKIIGGGAHAFVLVCKKAAVWIVGVFGSAARPVFKTCGIGSGIFYFR